MTTLAVRAYIVSARDIRSRFVDNSPEDYSPGVETFDQFSQIYFNISDKTPYYRLTIW